MDPCLSATVRAGSATGVVLWLVESCSFATTLRFDGPEGIIGSLRYAAGGRPGEFVTVDGLVNHLRLSGLIPDRASTDAIAALRDRVTRTFGDVELVGLNGSGDAELFMALPDGRTVPLRPEVDHPAFVFGWGSRLGRADTIAATGADANTMATARALVRCAWSRRWGCQEEMLAQTLAANFLSGVGRDFSLNANSLCDWYLFDADLTTTLSARDLVKLRGARRRFSDDAAERPMECRPHRSYMHRK